MANDPDLSNGPTSREDGEKYQFWNQLGEKNLLTSEQSEREGEAPSGFAGLHSAVCIGRVEGATRAPYSWHQGRSFPSSSLAVLFPGSQIKASSN